MSCEFLGRVAREFLGVGSAGLLEGIGSGMYHATISIYCWNCL